MIRHLLAFILHFLTSPIKKFIQVGKHPLREQSIFTKTNPMEAHLSVLTWPLNTWSPASVRYEFSFGRSFAKKEKQETSVEFRWDFSCPNFLLENKLLVDCPIIGILRIGDGVVRRIYTVDITGGFVKRRRPWHPQYRQLRRGVTHVSVQPGTDLTG